MAKEQVTDEKELVAQAVRGDADAVGQLYEMYRSKGIAIARQYVKTAEDAEDMYQDAFLKAMGALDRFDQTRSFQSWLDVIIVNTCKDYLDKTRRTVTFTDEASARGADGEEGASLTDRIATADKDIIPEEALDRKALKEIMEEVLSALPEAQKEAVVLFYYKEMSVKQIAQMTNVSEDTVKSRLNYARKKAHTSLEAYEKKHNIKLYSLPLLPFLFMLYFKSEASAHFAKDTLSRMDKNGPSADDGTASRADTQGKDVADGADTQGGQSYADHTDTGDGQHTGRSGQGERGGWNTQNQDLPATGKGKRAAGARASEKAASAGAKTASSFSAAKIAGIAAAVALIGAGAFFVIRSLSGGSGAEEARVADTIVETQTGEEENPTAEEIVYTPDPYDTDIALADLPSMMRGSIDTMEGLEFIFNKLGEETDFARLSAEQTRSLFLTAAAGSRIMRGKVTSGFCIYDLEALSVVRLSDENGYLTSWYDIEVYPRGDMMQVLQVFDAVDEHAPEGDDPFFLVTDDTIEFYMDVEGYAVNNPDVVTIVSAKHNNATMEIYYVHTHRDPDTWTVVSEKLMKAEAKRTPEGYCVERVTEADASEVTLCADDESERLIAQIRTLEEARNPDDWIQPSYWIGDVNGDGESDLVSGGSVYAMTENGMEQVIDSFFDIVTNPAGGYAVPTGEGFDAIKADWTFEKAVSLTSETVVARSYNREDDSYWTDETSVSMQEYDAALAQYTAADEESFGYYGYDEYFDYTAQTLLRTEAEAAPFRDLLSAQAFDTNAYLVDIGDAEKALLLATGGEFSLYIRRNGTVQKLHTWEVRDNAGVTISTDPVTNIRREEKQAINHDGAGGWLRETNTTLYVRKEAGGGALFRLYEIDSSPSASVDNALTITVYRYDGEGAAPVLLQTFESIRYSGEYRYLYEGEEVDLMTYEAISASFAEPRGLSAEMLLKLLGE